MNEVLRLAVLALLSLGLACSGADSVSESPSQDSAAEESQGSTVSKEVKFIHTVFFWIKEEATQEQRQQLLNDCTKLLGTISSVKYIAAGKPAGTPREVVDSSFGVGLVVHFADKEGHDLYQEAPAHLEFIERNQETWDRVQVYDTLLP